MEKVSGNLLYTFLGIVLCCHCCQSRVYLKRTRIVYSRHNEASYEKLTEESFGFRRDGEVHYSLTCPITGMAGKPDLWLLMCDTTEARELSRFTPNTLRVDCQSMVPARNRGASTVKGVCQRFLVYPNSTAMPGYYYFTGKVTEPRHYVFMLLQCPAETAKIKQPEHSKFCQSELRLLNPMQQHLSADEAPLPLMYTIFSIIWSCVLGFWLMNAFVFHKFSNHLHKMITCIPIFKLLAVVMVMLQWDEVSQSGMYTSDLVGVVNVMASAEDALLFLVIMLCAEGWGILHTHIKKYRWITLAIVFLSFTSAMLCVFWVHKYFLAFSVCCVVLILYKSLKWTSHNVILIRKRRRKMLRFISRLALCYQSQCTIDAQLSHKETLYKRFRIVSASFCILYAVAITLATFLQEFAYIRTLAFEIPELIVFICIGYIFRLRNFSDYEKVSLYPPRETFVVVEPPTVTDDLTSIMIGRPLNNFVVKMENEIPEKQTLLYSGSDGDTGPS